LVDCFVPCSLRVSSQRRSSRWPKAFLALAAGLPLAGCLVEAPPEFELELSPPAFYLDQAVPSVLQPIQVEADEPAINFSVPFYWEGIGGPLQGRFYWEQGTERRQISHAIPVVGSLVQFPWRPPHDWRPGCRRVTLILTYASNFDTDLLHPKPLDPDLAAVATWWVAVDTPPADLTLEDCLAEDGDVSP
jgi:hypothetical protein